MRGRSGNERDSAKRRLTSVLRAWIWPVRLSVVALAGALIGAAMAWASDQGRTSITTVSDARDAIGSLSSPWLVIPLIAGATFGRSWSAALAGLVSTFAALIGWYSYTAAAQDLGVSTFAAAFRLELSANMIWFIGGVVSGPVFGAIGHWLAARYQASHAVAAVGALLIGEPLVMFGLTLLHTSGALSADHPLPSVFAIISRIWVAGTLRAAVLAGEAALGIVVLLLAWRSIRTVARRPS
jgi:hypothetical protein